MKTDQEKLRIWCGEYALYRVPDDPTEPPGRNEAVDFTEEPPPKEGQIRLWPAGELDGPPLYGLLVSSGYSTWLVIPFSPLSEPAVPSEIRVREAPPVQVLEGWNRRLASTATVRKSWCADQIAEEIWFWLRDWLVLLDAGEEVTERFQERVGPPLRHPLDPRHEYLDAEAVRAEDCLGEPQSAYGTLPEAKAAEPEEPYGTPPDGPGQENP